MSETTDPNVVSTDNYGNEWIEIEHSDIEGSITVTKPAYEEVYKEKGFTIVTPEKEARSTKAATSATTTKAATKPEGDT
jgi:hypothetical protein